MLKLPQGFLVGQAADPGQNTGCTVVLCPQGARGGVAVVGGAPGTRETDLLRPDCAVDQVHGLFLAGGSAFGLDVGSGVMRYCAEEDIGFPTPFGKVPIVPGAVIYDLSYGDAQVRPDAAMGYAACRQAVDTVPPGGLVGVGVGATVGHALGFDRVSKRGLGSGVLGLGQVEVVALVVVNAFGEIVDSRDNRVLAGIQDGAGGFVRTRDVIRQGQVQAALGQNTTIGVILTNACLSKAEATRVAIMGHDGLARGITPLHTPYDGDTLFCLATGARECDVAVLGMLAAEAVQMAVVHAAMVPEAAAEV